MDAESEQRKIRCHHKRLVKKVKIDINQQNVKSIIVCLVYYQFVDAFLFICSADSFESLIKIETAYGWVLNSLKEKKAEGFSSILICLNFRREKTEV